MKYAFILVVVALVVALAFASTDHTAMYEQIVKTVNADCKSSWKASMNPLITEGDYVSIKNLMGDLSVGSETPLPRRMSSDYKTDVKDLPQNFLAADKFTKCASVMNTVHDQSACGSCWAVSAAAALSERHCIKTGVAGQFLSARDIMSCCSSCGYGCNGGWPSSAASWAVNTGVVTGHPSDKNSTLCVRYPFLSCAHHVPGPVQCSDYDFDTPKCQKSCDADSSYPIKYQDDKVKFSKAYSPSGEEAMMKDLYENGPMTVSYTVYADFMTYTEGVYKHVTGNSLGGHAVVLVGWGVDPATGVKFWLCKNNWNPTWGESSRGGRIEGEGNGYFRIVRGSNHCGIEGGAAAALP